MKTMVINAGLYSGSQLAKDSAMYEKHVYFTFYFKNYILAYTLILTLGGKKL